MEPLQGIAQTLKRTALAALLVASFACKEPTSAPSPKAAAHLTIHFLDQDAVVGLDRPLPGAWAFMDAGAWRDLDTIWTDQEGRAAVGRTAPQWVLLRDPGGETHRVRLSNEAEPGGRSSDQEEAEDQAAGLFVVWLWFSQVFVNR